MGKYAAIVAEVQSRISAQSAVGGRLSGWKVHLEPISRVEGLSDLPSVAVQGFELEETYRTPPLISAVVKVGVMVATARNLGVGEFAAGVEAVMNSIELDDVTSTWEGTLGGLCTEWVEFELGNVGIGDMSMSGVLVVRATPTDFSRGGRT